MEREADTQVVTRAVSTSSAADRRSGRERAAFGGFDLPSFLEAVVRTRPDFDCGVAGHAHEVARLAGCTAGRLGFDGGGLEYVAVASYLHDAGKRPPHMTLLSIFNDRAACDGARTACAMPFGIFSAAHLPRPVRSALDHLYETFDGTGVPEGLRGADIPIMSRIIAAADAFVDLTTNAGCFLGQTLRPAEALAVLRMHGGMLFDPAVIESLAGAAVPDDHGEDATAGSIVKDAALTGGLDEIPLSDVLQLLTHGRRSGRLQVRKNGRRGEINVEEGKVVDASTDGVLGEEAFHVIIGWKGGVFSFEPGPSNGGGSITKGTVELILDALRRQDEAGR